MRFALAALVLLVAAGLAGCSSPSAKDSDRDGIADPIETAGWTITIDLLGHRIARHVTSDPRLNDTDGDGVPDQDEYTYPGGLDPRSKDTDSDGLTDCQETMHKARADCENPNFHGPRDGGTGTSPNNADSDVGGRYYSIYKPYLDETGKLKQLTWGDGLSDGDELAGYDVTLADNIVHHVVTSPMKPDSDSDGLDDGEEALVFHSDPTVVDTDADGCRDGGDPFPNRAESYVLGLDQMTTVRQSEVHLQFVLFGLHNVPETGAIHAAAGQAFSLSPVEPASFGKNGECYLSPARPWVDFQITTLNGTTAIDIFSDVAPHYDGAAPQHLFWNVRTGDYSWNIDGSQTFKGPLHLSGAGGELWMDPHVL